MYNEHHRDWMLTLIFAGAGVIMTTLGGWLFNKFRDRSNGKGFHDFGLGPRGLLSTGGIFLMLTGVIACVIGILFN